ncbi:sulfurtransferase [Sneathiella chungangensis]|uniref:Sulfurtransferase n=1 Tax=Sneathiella chungangensis TaxID=1418234 RepID=A0A845MDP3_9PROT|nr:rhodanese-like domain-containing protein [Sneathiella chungangensis]MZR21174.1 sulfurtransferase [Sneathiella chungangensis]
MSPDSLRVLLASAVEWALFDIREAGEAEAGHIPGATFLPRRQIELRIADLVPDKRTMIVVYGDDSERANLAVKTLKALGYKRTDVLHGGVGAWLTSGGILSKGSNVPSKHFGEKIFEDYRVPQITADELADLANDEDVLICDIRLRSEHETARVPGAFYIGNFDIALAAKQLAETGKNIVCHCAGRTRSIIGAQTLRDLGVEKAFALKDGTMGWVLSGRELEKGPVLKKLTPSAESAADALAKIKKITADKGVQWCKADKVFDEIESRSSGAHNVYIFDVRQLEEYEAGHIPDTVALPGGQAVLRADDFIAVRGAPIFLIDEGGARAGMAALWLHRLGYPNVIACEGAIEGWRALGRPFEIGRGRTRPLGLDAAKTVAGGLDADHAQELISANDDVVIIDVDNSKNFSANHLPGSIWVPRGWLEERLPEIAPEKTTAILLTSAKELQSVFAAASARQLGYENAFYLEGGVAAWRKSGLSVETGLPDTIDPNTSDLVLPPYARGKAGMRRYLSWEKDLTAKDKQIKLTS